MRSETTNTIIISAYADIIINRGTDKSVPYAGGIFITLYISDLDGTLLNYAAKLKPRAAEMLGRMIKKGILFSYATARRFYTASQATAGLTPNIPVITMNGIILADPVTGERISTEYIRQTSFKAAKEFIIKNNETPIVYSWYKGRERVAFLKNSHKAAKKFNDMRKGDPSRVECSNYDELFLGDIYYLTFLNPENNIDLLNEVFSNEKGFSAVTYIDTYEKNLRFYEVWSGGVSKATAALKLKKLTGASKIIAFGDNLNDIAMFEAADECYAVENAHPDLKAIATGVIASNEEMGVPVFIEKRETKVWDYTPLPSKPEQFKAALSDSNQYGGVGELNEKPIHAALKRYFSAETDREVKIGPFIADAAGENGIVEIQTAGWGKLNHKLDIFLDACHVTVVYPFEQIVHHIAIHEKTGELIKNPTVRNNKNITAFFLELHRIKGFLTNPNLTVCFCGLEIERTRFIKDPENKWERRQKKIKKPLALLSEIYLNKSEDYRVFLPDNLPEKFTIKEFEKLSKKPGQKFCGDASVIVPVLEYMSVVHKCGKKGNSFIYCL
ncbi:MAG: HAD family hydrolase [Oscillospiraceae bacterium]|nr:HAD family hydrolase [Oscillospiraceae bacterium]